MRVGGRGREREGEGGERPRKCDLYGRTINQRVL